LGFVFRDRLRLGLCLTSTIPPPTERPRRAGEPRDRALAHAEGDASSRTADPSKRDPPINVREFGIRPAHIATKNVRD